MRTAVGVAVVLLFAISTLPDAARGDETSPAPTGAAPEMVARDSLAGGLYVGLHRLSFRDDQISSLYESPLALTVGADVYHLRRIWLTLEASYALRSGSPIRPAYVDQAATRMGFLPLRMQIRLRYPIPPGWVLWAGPQVAWIFFHEKWEASVPGPEVSASQDDSGAGFAIGATAGVRIPIGPAGALRAGFEWLWADADRQAVPGSTYQTTSISGGWSAFSLTWELPWVQL